MPTLADLQNVARGGAMGLTTDFVGGPVDIVNEILRAMGLPASERPVMGSEWLADRLGVQRDGGMAETGARIAAGFASPLGAAKAAVGLPLMLLGTAKGGGKTMAALKKAMPEMAERYPQTVHPVPAVDKTSGNPYAAKTLGDEAKRVEALRKDAQKKIDAGEYSPYFDVEARTNVDPANYPAAGDTRVDAMPKKDATTEKWRKKYDTPEVRARLNAAFDLGLKDPAAKDWYAMRQLEDEFIRELGPEAGRAAFKEKFADAMAATTGGADPTANLLTAAYANYVKNKGMVFPRDLEGKVTAFDVPYPVGGRYLAGNLDMADKTLLQGAPLSSVDQPKRHNFSGNFLGRSKNATIDEQMMSLFHPGKAAPEGDSYGVLESILAEIAASRGVDPMNFQDVAWLGAKRMKEPGAVGKPMIQHVNEMLERTSRVTGLPVDEVLRGFIRSNMPMYGLGGAAIGAPLMLGGEEPVQ